MNNKLYKLGIDIGSTTVKLQFLIKTTIFYFQIMKDILPIYRIHLPLCF